MPLSDSDELPSEEELEEGSEVSEEEEDEDVDDSDEEEDDEDEEDEQPRRPRKRQKAELPPPGRELPQRATRGQRMGALVKDVEEDQADEEFWNQDFFREEEEDVIYTTESEPEDVADADFSESEGEEDDGDEAEAEARAKETKKKTLKPPGYKKPPLPPRPKPPGGAKAGAPCKRQPSLDPELMFDRRKVRESTRQKVEEAEEERKMLEKCKPRRVVRHSSHRPLTQAELLAEAAKTEIENTRSLELLQFIEEQTRKKAEVKKAKYAGPMLRFVSKRVDGQERSMLEVRNMPTPPELLPQRAPPPPPKPLCALTGLPAKYRDPHTGLPYSSLDAYRQLQLRGMPGGHAQHAQHGFVPHGTQHTQQGFVPHGGLHLPHHFQYQGGTLGLMQQQVQGMQPGWHQQPQHVQQQQQQQYA